MALTDPGEPQVIARAAAGDARAMGALLEHYRGTLLAYAGRHLPDELRRTVEPQDVVQDVFFEAFRRLEAFEVRDPDAARRWLLTIARNRVLNLIKWHSAAKRRGVTAGEDGPPAEEPLVVMLADLAVYERTPSASAIAHEQAEALERAIQRLPADYRTAVRLRFVEQRSIAEVATALNRTERAVQMVCNRALKLLRREMERELLGV